MNTEIIVLLSETLERLGFKGLGHQLMKRICFKPSNFTISHKITKGDDAIDCHLFFEKGNALDSYVFVYYDLIIIFSQKFYKIRTNLATTSSYGRSVWTPLFSF